MRGNGLLKCAQKCVELNVACPNTDCKHWINYSKENNCTLVSVKQNGSMTLRQIAERLHLSFARIKQIETKALIKIRKHASSLNSFF